MMKIDRWRGFKSKKGNRYCGQNQSPNIFMVWIEDRGTKYVFVYSNTKSWQLFFPSHLNENTK